MAEPDWINYDEKVVGENHPSLTDVANRPGKTIHANFIVEHDAAGRHTGVTASLADDAAISLDSGKSGWVSVMAGGEYIEAQFTAAGVVTVITNSANAVNTDTDGCLCVIDGGDHVDIKNRLGATKAIRYLAVYS